MSEITTRYLYYFEGEYLDEDDMPETPRQHKVANYLEDVLGWFFRFENYIVSGNVNIYRKGHWDERVAPDVMVIKNAAISQAEFDDLKSYAILPPEQPAPAVVIEVVSDSTRPIDIVVNKKPTRYGELGVKEYFAFDPDMGKNIIKLIGWRYIDGLRTDIKSDKHGRFWSEQLNCWLMSGGKILLFYDVNGNELVSGREAEQKAREAETLARQEAETLLEAEQKAREAETLARQETETLLEAEQKARAEAERLVAELRAKLENQP
jgi:Uma2 family endonuclease